MKGKYSNKIKNYVKGMGYIGLSTIAINSCSQSSTELSKDELLKIETENLYKSLFIIRPSDKDRQKELDEIEALLGVSRPKRWYDGHPQEKEIRQEMKVWKELHKAEYDSLWNGIHELNNEKDQFKESLKTKYDQSDSTSSNE